MRIGMLADVHGNLPALQAVLADGEALGVERWLVLGDVAFRGPAPEECLELIRSLANGEAVMGNTEEWLPYGPPAGEGGSPEREAAMRRWWEWTAARVPAALLQWVEQLPRRLVLRHGEFRLLGVHATARGLEDRLVPSAENDALSQAMELAQYDAGVCAHIHVPYLRSFGGKMVFNCGSVGRPIDADPRSSYVVADLGRQGIDALAFRRVQYDIDATEALCVLRGFPWSAEYVAALRAGRNF